MLTTSALYATISTKPTFLTVSKVLSALIGLSYILIGISGCLPFLLPAARIWAVVTGSFNLVCGTFEKPLRLCENSRFYLAWYTCTQLSILIVPGFVIHHYGFQYTKLNVTFGMPVLLAIFNSAVAVAYHQGQRSTPKSSMAKPMDLSETEGLLHPSDVLSTGTAYDDGGSQVTIDISGSRGLDW